MSIGNIGAGYLVIGGEKYPVCVTEFFHKFGEPTEFRGQFFDHEYASGGFIPVGKSPIKNVIFNDPATVVIWDDGSKTVVKCQPGDTYSKETGLALCIAKKFLGNKGNFNDVFKKWIPEEADEIPAIPIEEMREVLYSFCDAKSTCNNCPLEAPRCRCGCGVHFKTKSNGSYEMNDEEILNAYKIAFGGK